MIPFVDEMHRVSKRIVTTPIQSQGIITRDNVSLNVSAVAYFRVVETVKSVVAIENLYAAIDQIAQTTLRKAARPAATTSSQPVTSDCRALRCLAERPNPLPRRAQRGRERMP